MMLHLLSTAINPTIPLACALRRWHHIASGLAERPRQRTKQVPMLCSRPKLS
jgi:hypothetical protein